MTTDRMTNAEAVILCRFAKACCPQQQFDTYTPDAWFELLRDLRFEDCKEAVVQIVKRQPFVAPSEIRDEIKLVRIRRLDEFNRRYKIEPPAHLADDPAAENRWRIELNGRIADGEITHPSQVPDGQHGGTFEARDVIAELGHIGQRVPARD